MHKMATAKQVETVESVMAEYTAKCARITAAGTTDMRVWHGAWKRARNKLEALGMARDAANAMVQPLYIARLRKL
jgi:hypothetical protein